MSEYSDNIESIVSLEMQRLGYAEVRKNVRIANVEVDRVMLGPQSELIVVEVKSLSRSRYLSTRVSQRQKTRLMRAVQVLALKNPSYVVRLLYAFYDTKTAEITIYNEEGDFVIAAKAQSPLLTT